MFPWAVILALVAANAFYVAAEFAAVGAQRSEIALLARSGNRRAAGISSVLESGAELDRYIAACQIGITLSSLGAGAYGQATIAVEAVPVLQRAFDLDQTSAATAAFLSVLLVLTALQVVLGELVPKTLALQFPVRTALATYPAMRWSVVLYRALIWLLNGSGLLLLKPFGVTPGGHQHVHSPEEIGILFAESQHAGELSADARKHLERGLRLSARTVRQMMTPRGDLHAIDSSISPAELIERVIESPYSRLPVYDETLDKVLGTVSAKDIVAVLAAGREMPPLRSLLRPIPFVPDSLTSHRFVRLLQEHRSSKAIVVDEHGGVQGIISIEDVLGELFGEIADELQEASPGAVILPDGRVRVPGSMRLDDAEKWIGARWEGAAATVGGHVLDVLGHLPVPGERVEIEGVRVVVDQMDPKAIAWIVVEPSSEGERTGEGSG